MTIDDNTLLDIYAVLGLVAAIVTAIVLRMQHVRYIRKAYGKDRTNQ